MISMRGFLWFCRLSYNNANAGYVKQTHYVLKIEGKVGGDIERRGGKGIESELDQNSYRQI